MTSYHMSNASFPLSSDLMLPGVVLRSSNPEELGTFPKERVTAISLVGNKSVLLSRLVLVECKKLLFLGLLLLQV